MATKKSDLSFKPVTENTFKFRCYKEIKCFTKCCADLNLTLTPYDILRIKKRLDLPSDQFLNRYTETKFDNHKNESGRKQKMPFREPGWVRHL